MQKKLLIITLLIVTLVSCGSMKDAMYSEKNVRKVELGMTKEKVISIMGKSYTSAGAIQTPEGSVEIIRWDSVDDLEKYEFHFVDKILKEWHRVRLDYHDHRPRVAP
ncbi:hypothetical protein [uncultured Dysgonomonas sp.]|uniref:Lipoprotein SmpA/OmlA domain-containing protein n=1 Tax=uncultured Dysgonomonas sp. TaxID=206096 RepID=A0A212K645_9BACT|nr:hypothetical protein [uncultured Dysgonomonas sp.]SBW07077.1 conserved exported hypothetical protein [uncultured Dysgonomonas sp.]